MAGKILKSILSVAIAVLLSSFVVITGLLYQDFSQIRHTQLKEELLLAAAATEQLGTSYLEKLPAGRYRMTWIDSGGTVLFDSRADSLTMENHSDREEFREALTSGSGNSQRYSSTLTEKTIYEAIRLSDGSVLRISVSSSTVAALLLDMVYPLVIIAVLAIILSVWLARRMARQVVQPLNLLDLDDPLSNETYEELTPLLRRIGSQHREIQLQMQLLKNKQREFDQITGNMREALVLLDPQLRIIHINPAAVQLLQIPPSCEGKIFSETRFEPDMAQAIAAATANSHAEFMASVAQSRYLFNISSITLDQALLGIVVLALDVTEQANADKLRRDFTSNVSHELKTPLQSIIGSAELIENGIVKPEDMPRFMGHIRKEASRLVSLIDDIIRLSQLDEGAAMPIEVVSLLDLAGEVQEVLLYAAEESGVTLHVGGDPGVIQGVQSLLFELIYNLVDNGIRYNRSGGSVSVRVTDEADRVLLQVADTGIGIPPEHHAQVFERFYRVDKSHSRKSGGTGLGLSIVKHAAKYHHGTVTMDSAPGKGTTITVSMKKQRELHTSA